MKLLIVLLIFCVAFAVNAQTRVDRMDSADPSVFGKNAPPLRPRGPPMAWVNQYRPNDAEKKLLVVADEDAKKFAPFLRQPDTGLFRLLPFARSRPVVSVSELETGIRPGFNSYAGMYSFSKKKHGEGLHGWIDPRRLGWAELKFQEGYLVSGFMNESVALMIRLGDVPLDRVTLLTAEVAGLETFTPPTTLPEAFSLRKRLIKAYELNNYIYRAFWPASINTTYVLRSVSNKRADVLIGFRIIRQHEDGSLTILWKKLKQYAKPSWKDSPKQSNQNIR